MTIAAHIALDKKIHSPFLAEYLPTLAAKNPDDHFIFFIDKAHTPIANVPANCTQVIISPKIKNSLLLHYWYNYKLPYLLKRYNADIFLTENGVLMQRSNIPQIMIIKEVSLVKKINSKQNKHARYLQKYFPVFIKNATKIFTIEKYLQEALSSKYPFAAPKVITLYPGLTKNYKPITWQQKEAVTNTYTNEKDYFLYPVSANTKPNIIRVLKAFSQFKKWQKSSMQLVLLLQHVSAENLIKDLNLYRYRDEIKIISPDDDKEAVKIISSAYALIYLPEEEIIENTALNAMQAEVPVIAVNSDLNKSIYGEAAVYTTTNEKDISEKMILVYKDEHVRNDQIKKGVLCTAKYDAADTASQLWRSIIKIDE